MRLAEIDIENHRAGVQAEQTITLSNDPLAVSVIVRTLVTGQYQNKARAGLREIWANALDESATVTVQLPSVIDPRVVIRDQGPGLSHDDMMGRFTQLGASDKRESDEKMGKGGYGRLSPLAYSHQMTVRSFFNGQVGTYVIALEKNYIPRTVFYGFRPTTDSNGLEVSWNVKQDDIEKFRKEAQYTFFGGKDRTTITNETWKWEKDEILAQGPGWSLHNTEALEGPHVRMGTILYPLKWEALDSNWNSNWIKDEVLIVDVPIGSVDIQDSREALGYDERTIAYLKKRLAEIKDELRVHFFAELDKMDHIIKAALYLAKQRHHLLDRVCGSVAMWKGEKLPWSLDVPDFFRASRADRMQKRRKRRWGSREQTKTFKFDGMQSIAFEMFNKPISIFIDQGEKQPAQRIAAYGDWNGQNECLWIKTENVPATLEYLDNPKNVFYVSDLPDMPKAGKGPRNHPGPGANAEVLDSSGRKTERITEILEDGWFIDMEGRVPTLNGYGFHDSSSTTRFFTACVQANVYLGEIYGISEGLQKRKIFQNLEKLTPDEVRRLVGPVDILKAKTHALRRKSIDGITDELRYHHKKLKLPADIQAVIDERTNPGDCLDYHKYKLLDMLGLLSEQDNQIEPDPLTDPNELLAKRFPLLDAIRLANVKTLYVQQYINAMENSPNDND